MTEESLLRYS